MKKRKWFRLCILAAALCICGCEKEGVKETEYEELLEVRNKDYIDSNGNFLYYREGDKEFYGYMEKEQIIELKPELLEKEITFRGVTGELQVTYCTYDGESWVVKYENNPVMAGDDEYDFFVRSIDGNYAYLEMVRNAQQNEWSYPLLYNLEIGEITDYLKDVKVEGVPLAEVPQLSICTGEMQEKEIYFSCNSEIYRINVENQEAVSLNDLVKEERIEAFQILEDGYFLLIPDGEAYKGVYFDITSGEKKVLFEEITTDNSEDTSSVELIRMVGEDALLIKRNKVLYCRDQNSGEEWEIEDWKDRECVLREQIGDRALLSGEDSFGILDLEEKTYREIIVGKEEKNRVCRLCSKMEFTVCTGSGSSYSITKYKWKE